MAIIELEHLEYTYPTGQSPALSDLSLVVEAGEFIAITGANQAGKSTLCYTLGGLIPGFYHGSLHGKVKIAGVNTRDYPGPLPIPGVGLVLQNPANQISGVKSSVYDEVAFGLENLGVLRAEMPARIETALQQTGLVHQKTQSPFTLSGGQQQRLAIACILAMQPRLLILDEPTSMLDPGGARGIFSILMALSRQGVTIVVAEHRLEWIAEVASRVVALNDGRIILDGPTRQVLGSPLLVEAGVGETRYTRAARLAIERWPAHAPLPVTLEQAVSGFMGTAPGGDHANPVE